MERRIWKQWWWVVSFFLLIGGFYSHAMHGKRLASQELGKRFLDAEKEKEEALLQREELRLQLASLEDPAWIEMVLMRDLGLVPEGWLKVHFKTHLTQK